MITIYKYPLKLVEQQALMMPRGAFILHLALQHNVPTIWARVNTECVPLEERRFAIYGTGQELSKGSDPSLTYDGEYVGTYFQDEFVWHVFEVSK